MAKSFHQYSPRAQVAMCAALSVMGFAAAWQVLLGPDQVQLQDRRDRLAIVTTEVARATETARRLPEMQQQVADLELALQRTTAVLPDQKDAQEVLRGLHALASEANLRLSSFTPKPVTERAEYSEWPIEVGLEGGYHDLGRFFDRVAAESRLISVSSLHLKVNPQLAGSNRGLVATTFVFSASPSGGRP
jgi:Tfp pilus assembly protein PilO